LTGAPRLSDAALVREQPAMKQRKQSAFLAGDQIVEMDSARE
jgi:hypothetical protein